MSTKALARHRRPRRSARPHRAGIGNDYLRLIHEFPLCPFRTDGGYEAAAAILDRLAVRPEGSLSPGEQAYMETLTLLVQAYDDERIKIATRRMAPVEVLAYLMEQSGMTDAQLGELLGNRPLVSLIKHGHRGLSKTHIRLLSEHFRVEPGLFLESK
jgi:HTH-type transcriptional regulator / antitoxin HigA